MSTKANYIYIVGGLRGPLKVGICSNFAARISSIRSSSPIRLRNHLVARLDQPVARAVEARAHEILAQKRVRGEWFDAPAEAAVAAVFQAAEEIGCTLSRIPELCSQEEAPFGLTRAEAQAFFGSLAFDPDLTDRDVRVAIALLRYLEFESKLPVSQIELAMRLKSPRQVIGRNLKRLKEAGVLLEEG